MKRVIIVHGWGGSPKEPIHAWLKGELVKKGIKVISPQMPDTNHPKIREWVDFLAKEIGTPDKDTVLFGHSIGCQTIMRYLENQTKSIKGAVFLSGWFNLDNMESDEEKRIAKPWIETKIEFDKIKNVCNKFEVIISDDEPYGYVKENSEMFKKLLGANVRIEHGKGHFTESEGITKIPEVLDKVLFLLNYK